ncbi:hypothetical protein L9F63_014765 [Diploptera punctata]|uniref:Methyltransferase type 11 domain-containing protein n=1 Tax=Diploptera punctata TaxID=6984 RepID=A0AAD8A8K5_DIPPU|nr:hypothetical protein L9F63_014765 [Diploptera punctata]
MPLDEILSADWKLMNKGLIRILEIGFRTGENLKYYPKNSHLVIVDRNRYLHSYLESNPHLTSSVQIKKVIISSSENLTDVPDNSVDAVVGTFVLCSVTEIDLLLKDIKRVLVPVS